MSLSLVGFDTDQIKSYVFETGVLKEIRGASAILDQLNREDLVKTAQQMGGEIIYANGGAALVVIGTDKAQSLIEQVENAYRAETISGSVTGASVPIPDAESGEIQAELSLLRYMLRLKKDGYSTLSDNSDYSFQVTHPFLRFCDSCGHRYASDIGVGSDDLICDGCQFKRKKDRSIKNNISKWSADIQSYDSNELWARLLRDLDDNNYPVKGYERPDDFEALAKMSNPTGYMGLIYADGDGMGRIIEGIQSQDALKTFANAVDNAVYDSVVDAVSANLKPHDSSWPFDILMLGGDDLVMVTQAQSAISVALQVMDSFSKKTAQTWGKPLYLSASVVIAHAKYPIASMIELAEDSLKFAKYQGVQRRLSGETLDSGLLNFVVVNNPNHLRFTEYYEELLVEQNDAGNLYRTQRPYSVDEMRSLLSRLEGARNVPRGKLEQLRTAVFKSRQQGTIDAMMATLRLNNNHHREAMFQLVGSDLHQQVYLPWIQQNEDWATPILDIVELMDFVE